MTEGRCEHPSVFIEEELAARGWSREMLAARMGPEFDINLLSLDFYLEAGPYEPSLRIGEESALRLGSAFGVSPRLFLDLEKAWLDGRIATGAVQL